jgi:bifunctional DNA primase/polymerase-like protein
MTSLCDSAVALGKRGLPVFPCWPRRKEPAVRDFLRLAAIDPVIIRRFWGDQGQYNIGLVTGRRAGVWVLDIDGNEGEATLAALEKEHGALPPTVGATTGNGRHDYFNWADGFDIRNAQNRDDLPGLDWRGEGGYVLAPPSIHPSGREYAWSVDSANAFADAPDWLLRIVTARSARRANGNGQSALMPQEWDAFMSREHEGSRRASAIAKVFGLLVRKDVPSVVALEFARMFDREKNKDSLGEDEVKRICDGISELEIGRRVK